MNILEIAEQAKADNNPQRYKCKKCKKETELYKCEYHGTIFCKDCLSESYRYVEGEKTGDVIRCGKISYRRKFNCIHHPIIPKPYGQEDQSLYSYQTKM